MIVPPWFYSKNSSRFVSTKITTQPVDTIGAEGGTVTFLVVVSGTVTGYQWQGNTGTGWIDIPGATNANYTTPVLALADSGNLYRVIVNVDIISNEAELTVLSGIGIGIMAVGSTFIIG